MKFQLARSSGENVFTGYGAGYVMVNQQRYQQSVVVSAQHIIDDWHVERFEELASGHFERLLALKPEIVLLGSGTSLRFPQPALTRSLTAARIGLEVMDTPAACRTYNILINEGRNAVAAILIA